MGVSLGRLSLADAVELGARVRAAGEGATSMEEVAVGVVRLINEATDSGADDTSCVLVRCFITLDRSRLPTGLARLLQLDDDDDPDGRYLALLATEGVIPDWCDRRRSRHHQVIPLAGSATPATFPMVTQMFRQFGSPLPRLITQRAAFVEPAEHGFGVFHVEEATGSTDIPDQHFIAEYRVASVVGVGGRLPTGEVFAVLIFSREPIDRHIAQLLQPLAMSIKLAFLPVLQRVFADDAAIERPLTDTETQLRVEAATWRTLLEQQEALIADHHRRLLASGANQSDTDLTNRERQILELVATGATNKQIAANLQLSTGTVKWHMYHLFQKLHVETRTEAVVAAHERGLVHRPGQPPPRGMWSTPSD
jgi:DNA-binding CsgD family transcriptional regulator